VYGDTDSMFILFQKKTKDAAFKVAYQIAADITAMYKKPVKLKFEKIYYPCVLMSKKRYVRFSILDLESTPVMILLFSITGWLHVRNARTS
jgi:DNA polymerase elongation subunit (family B)